MRFAVTKEFVTQAVAELLAGTEWGEDEVMFQIEFLRLLGIEVKES